MKIQDVIFLWFLAFKEFTNFQMLFGKEEWMQADHFALCRNPRINLKDLFGAIFLRNSHFPRKILVCRKAYTESRVAI